MLDAERERRKRGESPAGIVSSGPDGAMARTLTEDNLALAFTDQHRDRLRFSHDRGRWFEWDGARWREDSTDIAFNWTRELCRTLNVDGTRQFAKAATAAAVERFARADRAFAMRGDEWDANPWLLGTPGGTVDLHSGERRPAKPADLITRSTSVTPEQGEPALWRRFLVQATRQDEELELFLRQIAGYALTGDTREECLFYVHGLGGNGKGTFIGALHEIFGDYSVNAAMDTFLTTHFERHSTDLAMLRGARLVIASETREGRSWDEQRVKGLTGGDVVTARFMREDNFSYRPTFKLMLFGNHKPALRNVDDAWRRRFRIVPFTYKPLAPDPELKERLRAEYPQILQWAIDGCLDWQAHGLSVPKCVKAETAGYFEAQDLFTAWLEDQCETERTFVSTTPDLFASWKAFAEAANEKPGVSRSLADRLAAHGFLRIKDELGIRGRGFAGLRLKVTGP
ncbi:MAG: phage/plasmid primase, P4 family [Burkholderiales bacterium]